MGRQCERIKANGVRCKIRDSRVGLDGLCSFHRPSGCVIRTKSGDRCRWNSVLDERGRCTRHREYAVPGQSMCQGTTTEREPCRLQPLPGQSYCSLQHVPKNELPKPSEFEIYGLRNDREKTLVEQDGEIDWYTGQKANVFNRKAVEMDHIVEKQVAATVLHFASLNRRFVPAIKTSMCKKLCAILNDDRNLCMTAKAINRGKGEAIKDFLNYYNFTMKSPKTLAALLTTRFQATADLAKMAEKLTQNVMKEMKRAFQFILKKLKTVENKYTTKHPKDSRDKDKNKATAAALLIKELARVAIAMGVDIDSTRAKARSSSANDATTRSTPRVTTRSAANVASRGTTAW